MRRMWKYTDTSDSCVNSCVKSIMHVCVKSGNRHMRTTFILQKGCIKTMHTVRALLIIYCGQIEMILSYPHRLHWSNHPIVLVSVETPWIPDSAQNESNETTPRTAMGCNVSYIRAISTRICRSYYVAIIKQIRTTTCVPFCAVMWYS